MTFALILLGIHSYLRWVFLAVAAAAIVKHMLGLIQKSSYDRLSGILVSAFSGLIDLQATVGIILLIVLGISSGFGEMSRWEHAITMLIAAGIGHLSMRWKEKPDAIRYRNNLILMVVVILLIVAAIMPLVGLRWNLAVGPA